MAVTRQYGKVKVREALKRLATYDVRLGSDGKVGLYTKGFNVRVATFSPGSGPVQELLKELIEVGAKEAKDAREGRPKKGSRTRADGG